MGGTSREQESWVCLSTNPQLQTGEEEERQTETQIDYSADHDDAESFPETEEMWNQMNLRNLPKNTKLKKNASKKKKNQVLLEGYVVEPSSEDDLKRTKSLTDEDLDELKGCLDLGFGFSYDEIPELCNTLPALELCYSMSQKFLDDHQKSPERSSSPGLSEAAGANSASSIASWKISSPGDRPEDVKARLKFWAQAVACTVKLCN